MELTLKSFCIRCKGDMEEGFLLDYSDGLHYAGRWVKGSAEKSEWVANTVKIPKETKEIVTYRCTGCGYLESYAK